MNRKEKYTETTISACEPIADSAVMECPPFDKIIGVGPQSIEELSDDIRLAEREMKDSSQWDSFSNFMTNFKQTHAAWFK